MCFAFGIFWILAVIHMTIWHTFILCCDCLEVIQSDVYVVEIVSSLVSWHFSQNCVSYLLKKLM